MNITDNSYTELKHYFDNVINKDRTTYKSSNDEPTPISCIEEMLSYVPDEVWYRSDLKVLDPCCGNGNFYLVIYTLLMSLGFSPENILNEALYFNDTNEHRLRNVHRIFCGDSYNLNISNKDFLTTPPNVKFDIIVANPPYAKFLDNGKRASKNHNLIQLFLEKSLEILKPNGYLVFITPDNWMSCADRNVIVKKLTSLQLIHLNIHGAKKFFPRVGSSFTWYIVENCPFYKDVVVQGVYKKEQYLTRVPSISRSYIPLLYNRIVFSILAKTIDNNNLQRFLVETSSDLHKYTKRHLIADKRDDVHVHRLIHTPHQTVYASKPHKYQHGYKVFLSTTDKYNVFIDDCGMTQSIAFIRCVSYDDAQKTKDILMHPLYVFINNICRWGNFNNVRILQRFPIPSNSLDIYRSFDISPDEQNMIMKHQ